MIYSEETHQIYGDKEVNGLGAWEEQEKELKDKQINI